MALVHPNVCFPLLIFAIKIKTTRTAPEPYWWITLVQVCYCLKCNIMSFLKTLNFVIGCWIIQRASWYIRQWQ